MTTLYIEYYLTSDEFDETLNIDYAALEEIPEGPFVLQKDLEKNIFLIEK